MARFTEISAFARALFPDARLLCAGLVGLWTLTTGAAVAVGSPASPVSWSAVAAGPVGAPPAATFRDRLAAADGWGSEAEQAEALWQAALIAATDLDAPRQALALLERLRAEHPDSGPAAEALPQQAVLLEQLGSPMAGPTWRAAAQARPEHPHAGRWWLRAADAFVLEGSHVDAEAAYRTATGYPPQAAVAWLALGRLALESDPAAAHAAFTDALGAARRPATVRLARLGVATALERLEGPDAALAEVDDAIAAEGPDPSLERRRDRLRNGG